MTLGIPVITITEDDVEDDDKLHVPFQSNDTCLSNTSSPEDALLEYQKLVINEEKPKQQFCVCRVDGLSGLRTDIMGTYKKPDLKLTANPKVRFEEDAVGSGPIREFLVSAISVIDEGIHHHQEDRNHITGRCSWYGVTTFHKPGQYLD